MFKEVNIMETKTLKDALEKSRLQKEKESKKESHKAEATLSDDPWALLLIMSLIFGWGSSKSDFESELIKDRLGRLESKMEIIEKLVTK